MELSRAHAQYYAFASNTLLLLQALQKWQLGFGLCIFCPVFALIAHAQLFLVSYFLLVFCC